MTERLEHALREVEIPDEVAARERARQTVLAAHAQAAPRRRPRASLMWVAVVAAASALAATQLSPAQAIERIWQTVVERPAPRPKAPPTTGLELPARGQLLVTERGTLYLVEHSGKRRRLGAWQDATWSPNALFAAVSSGSTLAAIQTNGTVRWRLRLPHPVSFPRWAPDGTHIAYRSGGALRIVYGNGVHDVLAGAHMAPVAPVWRPGDPHTIAWASSGGVITVEDADTASVLWTYRAPSVSRLAWSADGRKLLVAGRRNYSVYDVRTGTRAPARLDPGSSLVAAAFAPRGDQLAIAEFDGHDSVVRVDGEIALSAPGRLRDLVWAPDGRSLIAGWPGADHWLVVRASGRARESAVSAVRHRFGPGSRVRGWCC